MHVGELDFGQYCGLHGNRFEIDQKLDAEWYFGNRQVCDELLDRIRDDFNVRGVPKCGIFGRFGFGKTHTLHHLIYLFEDDPKKYPAIPFLIRIAPYDESSPKTSGWSFIHTKILDAMGETFLNNLVRNFNNLSSDNNNELSLEMKKVFRFGDENLRETLANVLSTYFLRDLKSTIQGWTWLKGEKPTKESIEFTGIKKFLNTPDEMVNVILNIGNLTRKTFDKGIVILMDEAQALGDVVKREIEIHDAFLQLSEKDNKDVGFIFAYFGAGVTQGLPKVLTSPADIFSRLGASQKNMQAVVKDLHALITTEKEIRQFIDEVLAHLVNKEKVKELITGLSLSDKVDQDTFPFTSDALDKIANALFQDEEYRNPRMIIDTMAKIASRAYLKSKDKNAFVFADEKLSEEIIKDL